MKIKSNFKKLYKNIMAKITINEEVFEGDSVVINNNKIIINGREIKKDDKIINIKIDGDLSLLKVDYCSEIDIVGNVEKIEAVSGNMKITGDVDGITSTSAEIEISGNVTGDVETLSGNVKTASVNGKISTLSGNVKISKS